MILYHEVILYLLYYEVIILSYIMKLWDAVGVVHSLVKVELVCKTFEKETKPFLAILSWALKILV